MKLKNGSMVAALVILVTLVTACGPADGPATSARETAIPGEIEQLLEDYDAAFNAYDADAFQAFKENGLFDRQTAQLFRENILAKGGSEDPMKLYVQFRGAIPSIQPLLERRGLN